MQDFYICMELFEKQAYKDLIEAIIHVDQPGTGILYYASIIQSESQEAVDSFLFNIQLDLLAIYPPPRGSTLLTPLICDNPVEISPNEFRYYGYQFWALTPEKAMAQWSNAHLAMAMHHYCHWLKSPDAQLEVPTDRAGVFLRRCGGITQAFREPPKRKMTVADAAYTVLKEAGKPLKVKDILERMQEGELCDIRSKTPQNTLWTTLKTDIRKKGEQSLFQQVGTGLFVCNVQNHKPEEKGADMSIFDGRFANRLRELRENSGLSPEKMAQLLNVSDQTIYYWETGERQPKISDFPRIAQALSVSQVREILPEK